jgi:CYTH domain-containing protein
MGIFLDAGITTEKGELLRKMINEEDKVYLNMAIKTVLFLRRKHFHYLIAHNKDVELLAFIEFLSNEIIRHAEKYKEIATKIDLDTEGE